MYNGKEISIIDAIIPVYNGEKFILDAIKSIENQTLSPNKIIIIDDGSTDNTYRVVSEHAKTSKIEIKIVKKENGGLSSARNAGIKESDAEFIAFLDADDIWINNKLEEQIKIYKTTEFKNLALVYCDYMVIDVNGSIQYKNYKAPLDQKRMRGMVFKKLLERNQVASSGSGVLIRKKVFDRVGLFDENLRWGEDWDMWLRIAEKYEIDFVEKILVHIRKHNQNMTSNSLKIFEDELKFYDKWIYIINEKYPIPLFWSDKIVFRVISRFPKTDILKELKEKLSKKSYRILFKKTFGSFYLYIAVFLFRQIYNIIFYPNYFNILIKFIIYKGK